MNIQADRKAEIINLQLILKLSPDMAKKHYNMTHEQALARLNQLTHEEFEEVDRHVNPNRSDN